MNQRQKKKQLKKIVDLMNQIEIDDYDGQGNELFYVLAEANEKHQAILEKSMQYNEGEQVTRSHDVRIQRNDG